MPTIQITLIEGRTPQMRHRLISDVSVAAAQALEIPIEKVTVALYEVPADNYGTAGVPRALA